MKGEVVKRKREFMPLIKMYCMRSFVRDFSRNNTFYQTNFISYKKLFVFKIFQISSSNTYD